MMFQGLSLPPVDPVLSTMAEFHADSRENRVDLGVGVYRDAQGRTPVMRAVQRAQQRLIDQEQSKSYVGTVGHEPFNQAMAQLVLPLGVEGARLSAAQSVGGSGALRLLLDLVRRSNSGATVWIPQPSWPNHRAIIQDLGLNLAQYPYLDSRTGLVDVSRLLDALRRVPAGDVVILHGCCHNPSGADLALDHWQELSSAAQKQGWLPLVDLAYAGLGNGLAADVGGLHVMAAGLPSLMVAVSCSKNFGVYRDRVGCALVLSESSVQPAVAGHLAASARVHYSMPAHHGAAVVELVLGDAELRQDWQEELEFMRQRIIRLREGLHAAIVCQSGGESSRFDFLLHHRGMFSLLNATAEQVDSLKRKHAIYAVGSGRINLAGLPEDGLDAVAKALLEVVS